MPFSNINKQTPCGRSIAAITSNAVAGGNINTDYVYLCSGGITLTMPTAVGNTNRYTIKNTDGSAISIASTGAQTFDGNASPLVASAPGQAVELVSNGSNWNIL